MNSKKRFMTSESVTEGHPDKICDQIADSILDAILKDDPMAHVACEVCATTGLVLIMGEISTTTYVEMQSIVRDTVREIGYDRGKYGFDADNIAVLVSLDEQSPDIAMGVKDGEGAGDQGLMFGYATNETSEYMPLPLVLSHKLVKRLSQLRKEKIVDYLRPDGKAQVTIEYHGNTPVRVDSVVVSTQHNESIGIDELRKFVINEVIKYVISSDLLDDNTKFYVNPTGNFVVGGPKGDSGLTGRKIIVDTYGGFAHHGGGSFSGKDPTKVDRSAAYMARYIAKNIVAAGLADIVEVGLSYAIGVENPTSISIEDFGTSKVDLDKLEKVIRTVFKLTPKGIIESLELRRPIYRQTAAYGHFGRNDLDLSWERTDKVEELRKYF